MIGRAGQLTCTAGAGRAAAHTAPRRTIALPATAAKSPTRRSGSSSAPSRRSSWYRRSHNRVTRSCGPALPPAAHGTGAAPPGSSSSCAHQPTGSGPHVEVPEPHGGVHGGAGDARGARAGGPERGALVAQEVAVNRPDPQPLAQPPSSAVEPPLLAERGMQRPPAGLALADSVAGHALHSRVADDQVVERAAAAHEVAHVVVEAGDGGVDLPEGSWGARRAAAGCRSRQGGRRRARSRGRGSASCRWRPCRLCSRP